MGASLEEAGGVSDPAVVEVANLRKKFGDFSALDGVNLTVRSGSLHAIIGPNGAGKTTFFNILTGQLRPSSGDIRVHGRTLGQIPVHRRVNRGLGRSFQVTTLFRELSVLENVRLAVGGVHARRAYTFWSKVATSGADVDRAHECLERVGLAAMSTRLAGELSHGQQRLLELAMALAPRPEILLLDEPTSGMGADDIPAMETLLATLRGSYTVIVIEHNMAMTMRVADQVAVLVAGQVLIDAAPAVVRANAEVQRAYLGQDSDAIS